MNVNLILVLVIVALSFVLGMVIMHKHDGKKKKTNITSEYLSSQLLECSDLTTCILEYVNLVKFAEGSIPLITKRSFSMVYTASIRAGIDFKEAEITVSSDQVTVLLPPAQVQSISIDTDSLRFYDEHNALFKWNNKDDISSAIHAAREDVSKSADVEKLKRQAARQAELVVTRFLEPLIGEERQLIIRKNTGV